MTQESNVGADLGVRPPVGYELGERDGQPFIRCLACNMESFHPQDIEHRYCGFCHKFHLIPACRKPPVIEGEGGTKVSYFEIRICLACGRSGVDSSCPHCGALEHTRTVVIITSSRNAAGGPVVKVSNYGNHE